MRSETCHDCKKKPGTVFYLTVSRCADCAEAFRAARHAEEVAKFNARHEALAAHVCGEDENEDCQECCPHDERDHGICLDCGHDGSEDMMAAAYDRAKDLRKYGN